MSIRHLFPDQVFRDNVPVVAEDVTLLAAKVNEAHHLYTTLGETAAYQAIQN